MLQKNQDCFFPLEDKTVILKRRQSDLSFRNDELWLFFPLYDEAKDIFKKKSVLAWKLKQ